MKHKSSFFFPSETHLTTYRTLMEKLQSSVEVILIAGPVGVGKSLIVQKAMNTLSSETAYSQFKTRLDYYQIETAINKLVKTARTLPPKDHKPKVIDFVERIKSVESRDIQAITNQYLAEATCSERSNTDDFSQPSYNGTNQPQKAVMFFDDMQQLEPHEVNIALGLIRKNSYKIKIQCVICCTPQQEKRLAASLNESTHLALRLRALTNDEVISYINYYLKKSKGETSPDIQHLAIQKIVDAAKGIPGSINTLLRTTLITSQL